MFCTQCGEEYSEWRKEGDGCGMMRTCRECYYGPYAEHPCKYCSRCGNLYHGRGDCANRHNKKYIIPHSWANRRKNELTIISECPCVHTKKYKHHPDYSKPLEIILLCPACHGAEHARLRSLATSALVAVNEYPRHALEQTSAAWNAEFPVPVISGHETRLNSAGNA